MRMIRTVEDGSPGPAPETCEDLRCGCGSLLARVVGGAVELKCRRCKRVWRVSLAADGEQGGRRLALAEGGER